jgi:hypothetical protein
MSSTLFTENGKISCFLYNPIERRPFNEKFKEIRLNHVTRYVCYFRKLAVVLISVVVVVFSIFCIANKETKQKT